MTDVFKAKLKGTTVHSWRCMCSTHVWHSESILYTTSTQENKSPSAPRGSDSSLYCHLQHPRLSSTLGMRWRGGKIIRGWQPCDTPQQTSVLDAGTSVAQWWTQCKRDRKKNVTKKHSRTQAKSSHTLRTYNNTLTGQDTRLLAEPWLAPFQSASRVTLDKRTKKKKKKENIFGGHNKHSKELLKTNAKQTISSS